MTNLTTTQFLQALPDYTQSLSLQTPNPVPRKFACFADLTTEIRLDIWNLTFPGKRRIELIPHKFKRRPNRNKCHCLAEICTHHPIALFVNQESRAETLKWYKCVTRDRMFKSERIGGQMIYFRPGRDMLFLRLISTSFEKIFPYDWAGSLALHNKELFKGVKRFEISNWDWEEAGKQAFATGSVRVLDLFPALEVLSLSVSGRYSACLEDESPDGVELWRGKVREGVAGVRGFYERLVEEEKVRKVPRVVVTKRGDVYEY